MAKLALLIAAATLSPSPLAGDVYKCQDAAGKIEFRDRACDATHKSQKVDITPNSIETMTLEEVRTKSAELKAKQRTRQDAENKANADAYAAQEWALQQERALQDADVAQTQYYGGYYAGPPLRPPATPTPPPRPPGAPAMPTPPPKPPR
jgi:hypothetical protein